MPTEHNRRRIIGRPFPTTRSWMLTAILLSLGIATAIGRNEPLDDSPANRQEPIASADEGEARRMLARGRELISLREADRGIRMLETLIRQFPGSRALDEARLALGRHMVESGDPAQAIRHLAPLHQNPADDPGSRERMIEAIYLAGVAYLRMQRHDEAFPLLRRITVLAPDSRWTSQAYTQIGLAHFSRRNWTQAIEALEKVGTFMDVEEDADAHLNLAEAGRRVYVKVQDADLPVLSRLGQENRVALATDSGDNETLMIEPQTPGGDIFIGSIPTEAGIAVPGDGMLQVRGGDRVTARYRDAGTEAGRTNVVREIITRLVGTASLDFTLGDFQTPASAAFAGQPIFIRLKDMDLDRSENADTVTLAIIARYREDPDDVPSDPGAPPGAQAPDRVRWKTRSETSVTLTEQGTQRPLHSGIFTGTVMLESPSETPSGLTARIQDEIVIRYEDALNIGGDTPRKIEAMLPVAGRFDNRPRAEQDVVFDPILRARKHLVESNAFLELARIFRDMGLRDGAADQAREGLERVNAILGDSEAIPDDLRQDAFKRKWELLLVQDDYDQAISVCMQFNRLYPDSALVDHALMSMADARRQQGDVQDAARIYRQVLSLPRSDTKAEAQFRLAQTLEQTPGTTRASVIDAYQRCAEQYPQSPFAGQALAVMVDDLIEAGDYIQAEVMLRGILDDYPDADFRDSLLLKSVLVAVRRQDYTQALALAQRLISEYPESPFTERARAIVPRLEARSGQPADPTGAP